MFPNDYVEGAFKEAISHPGPWVYYDNDCEKNKRTTIENVGDIWAMMISILQSNRFVETLKDITGVTSLQSDDSLHGAGCHITYPEGWLQPHLDYALHPKKALERRISLVLFLNPVWDERWGGRLEFLDDSMAAQSAFYPAKGRIVLWEASDIAFHGVQKLASDATQRVTMVSYYLADPRPNTTRKRALFVPKRTA